MIRIILTSFTTLVIKRLKIIFFEVSLRPIFKKRIITVLWFRNSTTADGAAESMLRISFTATSPLMKVTHHSFRDLQSAQETLEQVRRGARRRESKRWRPFNRRKDYLNNHFTRSRLHRQGERAYRRSPDR